MLLYHYTNKELTELIPQKGENPKNIEKAVPCIWLTNKRNGYNGKILDYRYEIDSNDLCQESLVEYEDARKETSKQTTDVTIWYRYFLPIKKFKRARLIVRKDVD